ncbi:MAG TPA: hypothetical protein VNZ52_13790 [Candidatus Thermoplasmatota archaeon]|nr:hypothetical protein [Candidatus Thermoplasmatota archaeon]
MPTGDSLEVDGVVVTWDPAARTALMRFHPDGRATEHAARVITRGLDQWSLGSGEPFALLVDCTRLADTTPGWRAVFAEFFKSHRETACIAWFNANPLIRMTVRMFVAATRAVGAAFATEPEARAWAFTVMGRPAP